MTPKFEVGRHVKYMPPHKGFHDLYMAAERSGLSPRVIYKIKEILSDDTIIVEGGQAHSSEFIDGELDHKLGKVDNSWEQEKRREAESKNNFEVSGSISKRWKKHLQT